MELPLELPLLDDAELVVAVAAPSAQKLVNQPWIDAKPSPVHAASQTPAVVELKGARAPYAQKHES